MTAEGLASTDRDTLRPARSERKPPPRALRHIILIEPRALFRQCLSDRLNESDDQSPVAGYASLTEVKFPYEKADLVAALLLSVPSGDRSATDIAEAVSLAQCQLPQVPIVVIADCEELTFVRNVMSFGIQGYIPTSFEFTTFKEAIEFVRAGGTFVPASTLLNFERQWSAGRERRYTKNSGLFAPDEPKHSQTEGPKRMGAVRFTRRELDVLGQLREGKSNKLIARELSIGEGTVKLYVQRIMRKLHVHNRTQAALTVTDILSDTYSG
jgi:DNA-binding NarL/FixJ family response regulator